MADKLQVARDALHRAAVEFEAAAKDWYDAEGQLNYAKLENADLGIIGRMAHIPEQYNRSVDAVWRQLHLGTVGLNKVATSLKVTAEFYKKTEEKTVQDILAAKKNSK